MLLVTFYIAHKGQLRLPYIIKSNEYTISLLKTCYRLLKNILTFPFGIAFAFFFFFPVLFAKKARSGNIHATQKITLHFSMQKQS